MMIELVKKKYIPITIILQQILWFNDNIVHMLKRYRD